MRAGLERVVPPGTRVFHLVGVLTLVFLALEITTGILLLVYYRPSVAGAYHSMGILMDEVRLGWLVRSLHAWTADLLIFCALLHMTRVYLWRAYQAPRQVAWVTGVLLLVLFLALAFTGTLLPWDQYAYWATDSSRDVIARIPLLGGFLLNVFWGGWTIGEEVLLRFYAFHVGILPWVAMVCLLVHLGVVWRAGIRAAGAGQGAGAPTRLGDLALDFLLLALVVSGLLLTAAVAAPPALSGPADPLAPLSETVSQWYFLPARALFRALPGWTAALVLSGLVLLLVLVPFLDRGAVESRVGAVVRWTVGLALAAGWLLLVARR